MKSDTHTFSPSFYFNPGPDFRWQFAQWVFFPHLGLSWKQTKINWKCRHCVLRSPASKQRGLSGVIFIASGLVHLLITSEQKPVKHRTSAAEENYHTTQWQETRGWVWAGPSLSQPVHLNCADFNCSYRQFCWRQLHRLFSSIAQTPK